MAWAKWPTFCRQHFQFFFILKNTFVFWFKCHLILLFWMKHQNVFENYSQNAETGTHYNDVIMSAMASQITSLNRLFRRRSKKTSKLHVTGLCVGNSPLTGEFPTQRTSNPENISIWWHHHDSGQFMPVPWLLMPLAPYITKLSTAMILTVCKVDIFFLQTCFLKKKRKINTHRVNSLWPRDMAT